MHSCVDCRLRLGAHLGAAVLTREEYMQLPKKSTNTRKLIEVMPKDKGVTRTQLDSLMLGVGYNDSILNVSIDRLLKLGYLTRGGFGAQYRLSDEVLKNFLPKQEDEPVIVRPFRQLSPKNIPFLNPLLAGRLRNTSYSVSGTSYNPELVK
jgi:hypothetical protein